MCSGVGHTHCFLHIEEENYRYKVANGGDVYHQMPHKVVVLKSLLCVEPCADCVEYSAGGNEYKQREGGVSQKERKEENYSPSHNQINRQTDSRNRALGERLVEYSEQHHNPLNYHNQNTLPATYNCQSDRSIRACNGEVYHNVVEDLKYLLVL